MNKPLNTPNYSFQNSNCKDTKSLAQLQKIRQAFFDKPKTMKEVDKETGVMRESICWYCRTLRLQNTLFPVKKRRCEVTGCPSVWTWTTDPGKAPNSTRLNLF